MPKIKTKAKVELANAWAAVLCLGPLARLARAHILGDVDVLTHPEG